MRIIGAVREFYAQELISPMVAFVYQTEIEAN